MKMSSIFSNLGGFLLLSNGIGATANTITPNSESEDTQWLDEGNSIGIDHYSVHGRSLTVFGSNVIAPYNYKAQPGVGLFSTHNNNCTATLINRELIVTAAHCVTENVVNGHGKVTGKSTSKALLSSMNFNIGYTNGIPGIYDSKIRQVFVPKEYATMGANWQQNDYAIAHLELALGDAVGSMHLTNEAAAAYGSQLGNSMVSFYYPKNNHTGAVVHCCPILGEITSGVNEGLLAHQCSDSDYGSDGAPIFSQSPDPKNPTQATFTFVAMNLKPGTLFNYAEPTIGIAKLFAEVKSKIKADPPYHGPKLEYPNSNAVVCNNTNSPTIPHTHRPTHRITKAPSTGTNGVPTTNTPTSRPTVMVTDSPTNTHKPTHRPTHRITRTPTTGTNGVPTTHTPSKFPTNSVTDHPTSQQTHAPTEPETSHPTSQQTHAPTEPETSHPTSQQTHAPTLPWTDRPTVKHTAAPTDMTNCPTVPKTTAHPTVVTFRPTFKQTTTAPWGWASEAAKGNATASAIDGNYQRLRA